MSKIYKTARGKPVQMDKIKLANEGTVSVGNMRTNARGDILGAGNTVAVTRNQVMDQVFAVEEAPYSPNDTQNFIKQTTMATNAQEFNNLANNLTVPVSPSAIEADPVQTTDEVAPAPAARGSLASSVADTASVSQTAIPNPKTVAKSNGPSRI
jgi:hypothetical protein